jgi:hypothetical protein
MWKVSCTSTIHPILGCNRYGMSTHPNDRSGYLLPSQQMNAISDNHQLGLFLYRSNGSFSPFRFWVVGNRVHLLLVLVRYCPAHLWVRHCHHLPRDECSSRTLPNFNDLGFFSALSETSQTHQIFLSVFTTLEWVLQWVGFLSKNHQNVGVDG